MAQPPSPSITEVRAAINVLYHNNGYEGKDQASRWLEEFQHSVSAWEISNQLLHLNPDSETSYFAAQTMKTKIQFHFRELPPEQHLALRDSLLNNLTKFQDSKPTATQLSLALADLAVQSPVWATPVNDLLQRFCTSTEGIPLLLEILTVLPEELSNDSLRIGANRRKVFQQQLAEGSSTVLQLLVHCHTNCLSSEKIQCKLYHCFGSWVALGSFPPEEVAKSELLKSAFKTLLDTQSQTLHDAVTDCICNALYISEDMNKQRPLAEACFNFVMNLTKSYESAIKEDDTDRALNYARLFTEMAESMMYNMVHHPGQGRENLKTLEILLACAENKNYEVAQITFTFWWGLSEYLYKECGDQTLNLFRPYVERLIISLCHLCELDQTHEGIPDQTDDFQEFRERVSEVVQDTVFLIGANTCFIQILRGLTEKKNPWNTTEAGFYIMSAIAKRIAPDEPSVGPLLHLISSLPSDVHIALRFTGMRLLSEFAFWTNDHEEYIEHVFQNILTGLQTKEMSTVSATALENLCTDCPTKMTKHFDVLLQVTKAIDSLAISAAEGVIGLLKGVAHVLSFLPHDKIKEGLMQLCLPQVTPLAQMLHKIEEEKEKGRYGDPTTWLDRLASIFRHTTPTIASNIEHPCKPVIQNLWPVLSTALDKYKHDERIMERCCRCLRFAIRCVGTGSVLFVQPLVEQIITIYTQHQHSCFLYLGSILVDEYGMEPACTQGLLEMLKAFAGPTFGLLSKENGLRNHPDTVDDFFRLCIRFLQRCPVPFLENESIQTVMQLAIVSTVLDHKEANCSVMKFLLDVIKSSENDPTRGDHTKRMALVSELIKKFGQDIVKGLATSATGEIQTYMMPEVADVFWGLLQYYREPVILWFKTALNGLPSDNTESNGKATHQQIAEFFSVVSSAKEVRILWKAFRDFSRLYR